MVDASSRSRRLRSAGVPASEGEGSPIRGSGADPALPESTAGTEIVGRSTATRTMAPIAPDPGPLGRLHRCHPARLGESGGGCSEGTSGLRSGGRGREDELSGPGDAVAPGTNLSRNRPFRLGRGPTRAGANTVRKGGWLIPSARARGPAGWAEGRRCIRSDERMGEYNPRAQIFRPTIGQPSEPGQRWTGQRCYGRPGRQ